MCKAGNTMHLYTMRLQEDMGRFIIVDTETGILSPNSGEIKKKMHG